MFTEKDVLNTLDICSPLIEINHPYSYLIDSRLNVFRNENDRWAIITEKLGYNPRADAILLELNYVGNCFTNYKTKSDSFLPINQDSFDESVDCETLKLNAKYWIVKGTKIGLRHNKQDYINAGIELKEYEPNKISVEEAGRLLVIQHGDLFRATDEELYQLIPKDLQKILVLDKWYHKDYESLYEQHISEEKINITYEVSKHSAGDNKYIDYESFVAQYKQSEQEKYNDSLQRWQDSQPSSYETWQQIAKVIVTGNPSFYKPTLQSNTHWMCWPESGRL